MKELVEYDFTDGHVESISAQKMNAEINFMTWREEPVKLLFEDCRIINSGGVLNDSVECVVQSDEEECLARYKELHARRFPPFYLFTFINSSDGVPTLRIIARRLTITKPLQTGAFSFFAREIE